MAKPPEHRKVLGKGLSALLPQRQAPAQIPPPKETPPQPPPPPAGAVLRVPINDIEPNPLQPRTVFQPERLQELAQSIAANGVIQPLIVSRKNDRYQLIAGERRWRASRLAGLTEVPVVVQDFADDRLLEVTLIENIQREDLNPIEVAHAFERLGRELNLTHDQIGERTGKDRSTITNMLRLLRLPEHVQLLVAEQRLTMGHARAILAVPTEQLQTTLAERTVAEGLSVRQVEKLAQKSNEPPPAEPEPQRVDPNVKAAIEQLERSLGTRVRIIERNPQKGRIEIEYYSQEELDRIYGLICGDTE
ncbi:MAG: ParB/RepB/Spo0J family partition protein [Bryobacteraceae bacterium]